MTHSVQVTEEATTVTAVESPTSLDTSLEDVTVQTTEATTEVGVSPYIVMNEGDLSPTPLMFRLASGASAGASTLTVDATLPSGLERNSFVAIGRYAATCEIRRVDSTSGTTLALVAPVLENAHAADEEVFFLAGRRALTAWFGCKGDNSTDDHTALKQAMDECGREGLWLDGMNQSHVVSKPLVARPSAKLAHMQIKAHASFAPADAVGAMLMQSQGNLVTFTADASTNVFTTPTAHGIPSDNICVVFYGSVPTGITAGRIYFARDRTSLTFKVAATAGGSAVDLTSDGSGEVYCEVLSMGRLHLDDVYVQGSSIANLNGIWASLQQPNAWNKWRVDNCEIGVVLSGCQIGYFYNGELVDNVIGMELRATDPDGTSGTNTGMEFYGLNFVGATSRALTGLKIGSAFTSHFYGTWFENLDIAVDIVGTCLGVQFVGVLLGSDGATTSLIHVDSAVLANDVSYGLSACRTAGTGPMIEDEARGLTILEEDFNQGVITQFWQDPGSVMFSLTKFEQQNKSAAYTATLMDEYIRCASIGGAFSVNLPTAVGVEGKRYTVKKIDGGSNAVTVDPSGSQTIDGSATYSLASLNKYVTVVSNGTSWEVVANN